MSKIIDKLPFWHFDDDQGLMVFKDGSLGAGFRLTGYDLNCKTNDQINVFTKSIENLLKTCEQGYRLQVFYKLTPDVNELISANEDLSSSCDEAYKPVLDARSDFLRSNAESKNYFTPKIYFFVRSKPHPFKKRNLFDRETDFRTVTKDQYTKSSEKFLRVLKQVESILSGAKVEPNRITNTEWFNLCFKYLNLERSEEIGLPTRRKIEEVLSDPLSSQMLLTDLESSKDGVKIGKYIFKVVTLKTLPENFTYSAMVDEFTKLPFHFWISQNIKILDQTAEQNKLQLQRRITHSMASGSKNVSDLESENKLLNIEGLLTELISGSEKLVSMDFNVILWGETQSELEEKSDEVLKTFRDMSQSEGLIETLPSFDAFIKATVGGCEGFRHKKMKSSNASHLLPLYSFWKGNKEPVCLIPNRDMGLFSMNPFASELTNWNGIVFGGSGSGKSFNVTQLMLMFSGLKPRIVWIDNGASSKGMVESLGGEFMDLKVGSGISINLFDLPKGDKFPSPDKVRLVLAILEVILKNDDQKGLPKRHKALLEEAILKSYSSVKGRLPTLSDLRAILMAHDQVEMKYYGETLFSWCGNSAYGEIIDRQTNVVLSKDLVSIEVQSLNAHPELKDVLLLLLTSFIESTSMRDIERPCLLIVDEAERLFQTELAKQFVITCYRTWRKYNSGIWCLSQNYKDFLSDKSVADSLLPNTSHVVILRQKKIDWKHFREVFDFNEAQIKEIKSLKIEKGKFSELYYLQDENQAVLRLIPEPLSYWIATTDAQDKVKINKLMEAPHNLGPMEARLKLAFEEDEVKKEAVDVDQKEVSCV